MLHYIHTLKLFYNKIYFIIINTIIIYTLFFFAKIFLIYL